MVARVQEAYMQRVQLPLTYAHPLVQVVPDIT